jgi:murein DD-endopeptidase MepM/ murein hydrolase activator NlpD
MSNNQVVARWVLLLSLPFWYCGNSQTSFEPVLGCDGQPYPDPAGSPYVLPYAVGQTFRTGLTNCSSSFHAAGNPDQYAFDFDMPVGTPFVAARDGTVFQVVENAPSDGGGNGNYVVVDHGDGTYGLYLHSPMDGISVTVGQEVHRGDVLGVTGRSGLAGYPHLHFTVVSGSPQYPYSGIPVSFRNARPRDVVLEGDKLYEAESY